MRLLLPNSLLVLVAAIAAGVLYVLHPDDTSKALLTGLVGAFLLIVEPSGAAGAAVAAAAVTAPPATADSFVPATAADLAGK